MFPDDGAVPLWTQLAYTGFLCVLVPVYWKHYTPANFLWSCDVALALGLVAMWTGNPLPASMGAISIMLPQTLWVIDLIDCALTGRHHLANLTGYMFDARRPLFLRGLSLFHAWLPLLLLWLVARRGYDRRAILLQPVVTAMALAASALIVRRPGHPAGNLNMVLGLRDDAPQTTLPRGVWVALLIAVHAGLIQYPTHVVLQRLFAR